MTTPIRLNDRSFLVTEALHSFLRHMQAILLAIANWLLLWLRKPDHNMLLGPAPDRARHPPKL